MENILITGAAGFIGANLSRKITKSKIIPHLIVHNNSNLWRINNILPNSILHRVDVSNKTSIKQIIKKIEPDLTYHLASYI
jgi:nucleoside-diphosphate-sugar epimerase